MLRLPPIFFTCLIFGLLIYSCSGQDQETDDTDTNTTHTVQDATDDKANKHYYHLRGQLGDLAVTFDLIREINEVYPEKGYFTGFYRYDKYGGPIALYGSIDDNGQLILTEEGGWNQSAHTLRGKWTMDGRFDGEWVNGNGKDKHPLQLQSSKDSIVSFIYIETQDSIKAFPSWRSSPMASFSADWLVPQHGSPTTSSFVKEVITTGMTGRQHGDQHTGEALATNKNAYFQDYRKEMLTAHKEGIIDSSEVDGIGLSFNYHYDKSMQVYYNSDQLLTLGFTDYTYTGGAHGMYGTTVKSYDLAQQKTLQLSDVLTNGYEEALSEVLAAAVRTKYRLTKNEPLSAILFDDTIAPNDNFGLTDKGIFFVYQPYEVAAYAVGEIELYVAFEKISEYLQPAWQ